MKLFVISDIHGSRTALEAALAAFDREGADWIAILGDYLNHGPRNPLPEGYDPQGAAALLNERKGLIIPVRGNCDSEVDQMLLEFPMMSEYSTVLLGKRRVFLCHGHIQSPERLPPLSGGSLFLSGHTHIPRIDTLGDIVAMNPGSVGLPKGGSQRTYGIVEPSSVAVKTLGGSLLSSLSLD